MDDKRPRQNENVACRVIDGSAVLVSPEDSSLYWLNGVATRVWELADGTRSVGQIADAICAEYEVDRDTALRDAGEMLTAFAAKNFLTFSD